MNLVMDDRAQWMSKWRGPMLRFACLHLSPREEAEDAVQDSLLALLEVDIGKFQGADPKRYVFGILKNKITDRLRKRYAGEVSYCEAFADDLDAYLFTERGHWVEGVAPAGWNRPDEQMQTDQFFAVVDLCVDHLPTKSAQVFSMKEFLECEADEICAILGLSKTDYWQCMSRARKQIQLCLNQRWFGGTCL